MSKMAIQAFDQLYIKYSDKLSVLIQPLTIADTHLDPICCVYDSASKEIVAQIFNFIDVMGGKAALTLEGIEKYFVVRGLLEPLDGDEISDKKDHEIHSFVTKSSQYAGPDFQLKDDELLAHNNELEEKDKVFETRFVSPIVHQFSNLLGWRV